MFICRCMNIMEVINSHKGSTKLCYAGYAYTKKNQPLDGNAHTAMPSSARGHSQPTS